MHKGKCGQNLSFATVLLTGELSGEPAPAPFHSPPRCSNRSCHAIPLLLPVRKRSNNPFRFFRSKPSQTRSSAGTWPVQRGGCQAAATSRIRESLRGTNMTQEAIQRISRWITRSESHLGVENPFGFGARLVPTDRCVPRKAEIVRWLHNGTVV